MKTRDWDISQNGDKLEHKFDFSARKDCLEEFKLAFKGDGGPSLNMCRPGCNVELDSGQPRVGAVRAKVDLRRVLDGLF